MKRILSILALGLTSAACSTIGGPPPRPHPVPPPHGGACDAGPAQRLIGREATPATARHARRLSGARVVRYLRPGQIVTMEYRADRLNLHENARRRVARINCG